MFFARFMGQFDYKFKYVTKLDLDSVLVSLLPEELRKKSLGKPISSLGEKPWFMSKQW